MHKGISRGATLMLCLSWTALGPTFGESVREASDAIVFKNGDHLSGTLERVDNDSVQLHSAALGELTIRWTDIAEVESRDHDWKWEGRAEGIDAPGVRFRNAVMRTVDSAVVMQAETQTVAIPKGAALMVEKQEHPTAGLTQLMSPKASPSLPPDTSFALSLNAPRVSSSARRVSTFLAETSVFCTTNPTFAQHHPGSHRYWEQRITTRARRSETLPWS